MARLRGGRRLFGHRRRPDAAAARIVLLVAPILTFVVLVIGRSPVGRYLASSIPLALILLFQTFRVGVELTLSRSWSN